MGKIKNIMMDIQDLIENTKLSFQEIAQQLGVTVDMVYEVAEDLGEFDE
jgi:predicted XRE-type DNA-binding protein